MQRTLIIFKPDCVQRRLVGQILGRFEAKGLRIAALKLLQVDRAGPWREALPAGSTRRRSHFRWPDRLHHRRAGRGGHCSREQELIAVVRTMLGANNGTAAAPGSIRGDYSISKQNNLIHGSDSEASAQREIALWFKPGEVVDYAIEGSRWVFDGA